MDRATGRAGLTRIATAVAVAVAGLGAVASAASAAPIDNYTASYTFRGPSPTLFAPGPLSFTQRFTATPVTPGARTGILSDIRTSIAGAKLDTSGLATCSLKKIGAALSDSGCPKSALLATGSITASLGSASPFTSETAADCDPALDVWNAGARRLVFFARTDQRHQCLGGQIHTGAVPPFAATHQQRNSHLVVNVPIPDPVTHIGPYLVSVSAIRLKWTSVKRDSSYDLLSVGCTGQRAYAYTFAASTPGGQHERISTSGAAACG